MKKGSLVACRFDNYEVKGVVTGVKGTHGMLFAKVNWASGHITIQNVKALKLWSIVQKERRDSMK